MSRRLTSTGQGAPAWGDQPERRQVRHADRVPVRKQSLQVGRHAEHRGRALALDGVGHRGRVERAGHHDPAAGEDRAGREAQWGRVVERAEHEVHVGVREAPQLALLGDERGRLLGVQEAAEDPLGSPRRAAGAVDRAPARHPAPVPLRSVLDHRRQQVLGLDDQVRAQRRQDPLALVRRQPRVEGDREHPGREQRHHEVDVRRRSGHEQGDTRSLAQLHVVHVRNPRACPGTRPCRRDGSIWGCAWD